MSLQNVNQENAKILFKDQNSEATYQKLMSGEVDAIKSRPIIVITGLPRSGKSVISQRILGSLTNLDSEDDERCFCFFGDWTTEGFEDAIRAGYLLVDNVEKCSSDKKTTLLLAAAQLSLSRGDHLFPIVINGFDPVLRSSVAALSTFIKLDGCPIYWHSAFDPDTALRAALADLSEKYDYKAAPTEGLSPSELLSNLMVNSSDSDLDAYIGGNQRKFGWLLRSQIGRPISDVTGQTFYLHRSNNGGARYHFALHP